MESYAEVVSSKVVIDKEEKWIHKSSTEEEGEWIVVQTKRNRNGKIMIKEDFYTIFH